MKLILSLLLWVGVVIGLTFGFQAIANASEGEGHTPVTICHKPGTPAEHTIVVDDDAVEAHLAHGDYLGECEQGEEEPDLVKYRVVAGMPRYRSPVFEAEAGLECTTYYAGPRKWGVVCADTYVFEGRINRRERTYVRLRQLGVAGPVQVLLDLR